VAGLERVGHIIVIFLENRSFDNLYGLFPGADGISNAGPTAIQVADNGSQFNVLPAILNNYSASWIDTRFAAGLPNGPFLADRYIELRERTGDPVHRFYQEQEQINNGQMNRFVAVSDVGALPMAYFDGRKLPLFHLAEEYTLADRFFHAAFGGGFLNHMWLVCACTPRYDDTPPELMARLQWIQPRSRARSATWCTIYWKSKQPAITRGRRRCWMGWECCVRRCRRRWIG